MNDRSLDVYSDSFPVPVFRVRDWPHFRSEVVDLRGWIYRGQRRSDWSLTSSLEREVAADRLGEAEKLLLHRYKQVAHNHFDRGVPPTTRLEWLGSMQHHGAPTRLLDFTWSPFVAAYFALEDAAPSDTPLVWAFHVQPLIAHSNHVLKTRRVAPDTADTDRWNEWLQAPQDWDPHPVVGPAELSSMSLRQSAQQSIFLVPGDVSLSLEASLAAALGPNFKGSAICFALDAAWRDRALDELRLMNITRSSLFPGLDGFAQSLKYSLRSEPRVDVVTRYVTDRGLLRREDPSQT